LVDAEDGAQEWSYHRRSEWYKILPFYLERRINYEEKKVATLVYKKGSQHSHYVWSYCF